CVATRHRGSDARQLLRVARVDVIDRAACDRALYDQAVRQLVGPDVGAVARGTGHLEPPVDAIDRRANRAGGALLVRWRHRDSRRTSARTRVRLASSILKTLWVRPTAPASAASAAARYASRSGRRPRSASSAAAARQGFVAMPP